MKELSLIYDSSKETGVAKPSLPETCLTVRHISKALLLLTEKQSFLLGNIDYLYALGSGVVYCISRAAGQLRLVANTKAAVID